MRFVNLSKLLTIALLLNVALVAKEPSSVIIGAGVGEGRSELNIEHPLIAKIPLVNEFNQPYWNASGRDYVDSSTGSWAVAWEFLVGYKHFINDYIGLRYYANLGVQHYKSVTNPSKKEPIGFIDYTLNADVLLDFYSNETFAIGVLGGVGFGGTSLDKKAVNEYEAVYNASAGGLIPVGASDITQHFLNINFSAGVRVVIFQKIGLSSGISNCDTYSQGRRICSTPTSYVGHNFEVVAKFPVMTYRVTTPDFLVSTNFTNFTSRPEYRVKNPYRFTFRYIIEF